MMPTLNSRIASFLRNAGRLLAWMLAGALLVMIVCNAWVVGSTQEQIFSDINLLPANEVGLVLGTSNKTREGGVNLHFANRIEAAARAYFSGKIKHLLLSGDNHIEWYNEPLNMKKALMKKGIPETAITLDYAGFRTFDSVIRAKKVFKQKKFTIISQEFHNYRALFIGHYLGIDAVAYNAKEPPAESSLMTLTREYFARVKVVLDLYILDTEPKFLGEPVEIRIYDSADTQSTMQLPADTLQ